MADKIDIVVGASDKASSILRSVADQTQLLSDSLKTTETNAKNLEISMSGVTVAAGILAGAYAGLKAGAALTEFLGTSSAEFVAVEKAARSFDDSLKDLAKTIESGTNIDEKSILGLMKQARGRGFGADQLDDAAKAAIGLAEVMETSMTDGLEKVRQATEGNFAAFEALIPNINQLATSEEKLAAVSALATAGLEKKKDAANSSVAVFDRMNVEMNNLYETIGEIIEPFRQLAYQGIAVVAELLSQALEPAIASFNSQFSGMGNSVTAMSKWLTESIVTGFTLIEVTLFNLGTIVEMIGASVVLSLEQMRSNFEHIFTVAIPAYASWFADNFINILSDVGGIVIATFSNLGTSIGEIMAGVFNYISSGFSADAYEQLMFEVGRAANRGLLDGFEPVTKALPDIGERAVSEFEKTLQGMVDTSANALASEFDTKMQERMEALNKGLKDNPLNASINLETKGNPLGGMSSEVKMLQAVESRVMVRGSTEDPLLKLSEQQVKVLQDILNATVRRDENKTQFVLEPVT
jgi:hypothetical protein